MNSCNFRGFLLASNANISTFYNLLSTMIKENKKLYFRIENLYDIIQNIRIDCNEVYKVYLTDKDKLIVYELGDTSYPIFPNTFIPASEPLYIFLLNEPVHYLMVDANVDYKVNLTYDVSVLSQKEKQRIFDQGLTKTYVTNFEFRANELHAYKNIEKTIFKQIKYS